MGQLGWFGTASGQHKAFATGHLEVQRGVSDANSLVRRIPFGFHSRHSRPKLIPDHLTPRQNHSIDGDVASIYAMLLARQPRSDPSYSRCFQPHKALATFPSTLMLKIKTLSSLTLSPCHETPCVMKLGPDTSDSTTPHVPPTVLID